MALAMLVLLVLEIKRNPRGAKPVTHAETGVD
jgi:hypothetical protein